MNSVKRTFNALLGNTFRYEQAENSGLVYTGNWAAAIQPATISTSVWSVESGDAVLSNEASTDGTTSVQISGETGESTIINQVTLSDGQVDERIIKLKIRDNSVPFINRDYGEWC